MVCLRNKYGSNTVRKVKQQHGGSITLAEKGDVLNPFGRPRKMTSQIIADLKESGVEAVTPTQVSDAISVLLNLSVIELLVISEDSSKPVIIQRTAKRLATAGESAWDAVIKDNLDRAHGKARQQHDITSGGDKLNANPLELLPIEEQAEILRRINKANAGK